MDTSMRQSDKSAFWRGMLKAVGTQPKQTKRIRGASGLYHDVLAVGVDEERKRLVIISGEHDARSAVLAQTDIQAAIGQMCAVTVRPVTANLATAAKLLRSVLGKSELSVGESESSQLDFGRLEQFTQSIDAKGRREKLDYSIPSIIAFPGNIKLNSSAQTLQFLQQLVELRIGLKERDGNGESNDFTIDFSRLLNSDPIADDVAYGVCAIRLFEIDRDDIEAVCMCKTIDDVTHVLQKHDIYQFFFPAADNVALGVLDRGIRDRKGIVDETNRAPSLGHPFGELELLPGGTAVVEVVDALMERGLIVEGEVGCQLTERGTKVRARVKFMPKEGIVSKLINRFSLKFDVKDLFK